MGKSRGSKGSPYERKICKLLSKWYSKSILGKERDDIFWRTSGSGARATVRSKNDTCTTNSCGDIAALHEAGIPFIDLSVIELKKGYSKKKRNDSVDLLNSIDNMQTRRDLKPPVLERWLSKAILESNIHKRKHPLIIFKRDRKASCIVMLEKTFLELVQNNGKKYSSNYGIILLNDFNFVIMRLDDFLEWCNPKSFFGKILKRRKLFKCKRNE